MQKITKGRRWSKTSQITEQKMKQKDCAVGRIMKPYEFWLDKMMEEEWEDRRYWPLRKSSFVRETLALFGNYAQLTEMLNWKEMQK